MEWGIHPQHRSESAMPAAAAAAAAQRGEGAAAAPSLPTRRSMFRMSGRGSTLTSPSQSPPPREIPSTAAKEVAEAAAAAQPLPTAHATAAAAHGVPKGFREQIAFGAFETSLLLLFAYVSFTAAEALHLSGIVASLVCGIVMKVYTRRVMSWPGKEVSSAVFKLSSSLADSAVFLQIGLNVMLVQKSSGSSLNSVAFFLVTLVACLVGRAANVFPLSFALNCARRKDEQITLRTQGQMWHAGLRGAIAFASSLSFPTQNRDAIVWATASICLATIFIMGPTTTSSLRLLGIEYGDVVAAKRLAREKAEVEARGRALREEAAGGPAPARSLADRLDLAVQRAIFGRKAFEMLQRAGGRDLNEAEAEAEAISLSNSFATTLQRLPSLSDDSAPMSAPSLAKPSDVGVRVLSPALDTVAEDAEAVSPARSSSGRRLNSQGSSVSLSLLHLPVTPGWLPGGCTT